MEGLGDAAGAGDVNTIVPVSEVATGLRRPLGPGGFMKLSQASGVNHGISVRFHIGASGGRWQEMPALARNLGTCNKGRSYCGCPVSLQ